MARTIVYVQAGGLGTRLCPLLHQPGLYSLKALSPNGRNLLPFNHNSFYAVAKPVMPYFGIALSEPLIRRAVEAGMRDIRMTVHNMPETVIRYYEKSLGKGVTVKKFLYEQKPLDTAGGIVRDVMADMRDGTIKPDDTILVLGGDIRTDVNLEEFLAEHAQTHADVSIALAGVERDKMHRLGAAIREGDNTPELGKIFLRVEKAGEAKEEEYVVYGDFQLSSERVARIIRFLEKPPKLDPKSVINPGGLDIQQILEKYGIGALTPTNLQNASIYAIRAELIAHLAPLVFNVAPESSSTEWRETEAVNISGTSKFSDFAGDVYGVLTGSKLPPQVNPYSPTAEVQRRIIEDLASAPPQIFGYRHSGRWSDDGTFDAVLNSHFEILDDLIARHDKSDWPIDWDEVKPNYPHGVITKSHLDLKDVTFIPPVYIGKDVIIHAGAVIGPYAVIGRGWVINGKVVRSVLFPKKKVDREIERARNWQRFHVPADRRIVGSLVGSGFELTALNEKGDIIDLHEIVDSVVVSNGSQNVVSPITT